MYNRHFIKVTDSQGTTQRLDFVSFDAAVSYWRDHHAACVAASGRMTISSESTVTVVTSRERRVCLACAGTGTVVIRQSADGMFPDEDDCPACHGRGRVVAPSYAHVPAKAS